MSCHRPYLVARERERVLTRIAAKPELTLRALLNNLGSHKGRAAGAAIRAAKAKLFFLPAYSPDLNPIEQAFAKMKALLRKAAARTTKTLAERSARCPTASPQKSAQTTSATLDMLQPKQIALGDCVVERQRSRKLSRGFSVAGEPREQFAICPKERRDGGKGHQSYWQ